MMLTGSGGQRIATPFYDASGTITTGGTAQLVIPCASQRSSIILENISDTDMLFEFGSARATATLSSGTVASCSVTNSGFGFTRAPMIMFLGGGWESPASGPTYSGQGLPDWRAPSNPNTANVGRPAKGRCVLSGTSIGSITIDDPGAGYLYPPYVFIYNDPLDPYGCATPSATVGILLKANGGSYTSNGTACITDQISVFCATTGKAYTCKYTV